MEYSAIKHDNRRSPRRPMQSPVRFIGMGLSHDLTHTIDLSSDGVSLALSQPLAVGKVCAIAFDLPHDHLRKRALVSGRVTSCISRSDDSYRIGLRFVQTDVVSRQLIQEAVDSYHLALEN